MAEQQFQPLVSIIIPVYNGAAYMREAIDSALAQTYQNCEVIVVNDGSCDDGETEEIARSYGDKIRYFCKENGGVSTALNFGIAQMRGEYFSWLSHDDTYTAEKIERQVEVLQNFGRENIVICETEKMDKDGKLFNEKWIGNGLPQNMPLGKREILFYLLERVTRNINLEMEKKHFFLKKRS